MAGLFGRRFDRNRDGKMSTMERVLEVAFLDMVMDSDEKTEDNSYEHNSWDEDDPMDDLEAAGLDPIDLEFMDEDERREALEDAGLDPDDYEF